METTPTLSALLADAKLTLYETLGLVPDNSIDIELRKHGRETHRRKNHSLC
jgi:hypothetical protein